MRRTANLAWMITADMPSSNPWSRCSLRDASSAHAAQYGVLFNQKTRDATAGKMVVLGLEWA
jgi:hypothetical protein